MSLTVVQQKISSMDNYNYLVYDADAKEGVLVDCSEGCEEFLKEIELLGIRVDKILLTHTHWDHKNGLSAVLKIIPRVPIFVHEEDAEDVAEYENVQKVKDGDTIAVGQSFLKVLHTPGHKPGCVCYYNDDAIFTGDTVFVGSHGRTDLPGSDPEELKKSFEKLRELPDALIVYTGHAYGLTPTSTLGKEKWNA